MMGVEFFALDTPHPDPKGIERLGALLREASNNSVQCIGCGKFVSPKRRWNQCADCDTREPEEM